MTQQTTLNPNRLLDNVMATLQLRNDAALARALEVSPPTISKIRRGRMPVSPALLIAMHEVTGYTIGDLRFLMNDHRLHTGRSAIAPSPSAATAA